MPEDNSEVRLPHWLQTRYDILWGEFRDAPFSNDDAVSILKKKNKDKEDEIRVFISELRKAEWMTVQLDQKDTRKKIYRLKSKEQKISELLGLKADKPEEIGRSDIDRILKRAADLIRTRVDYKFILLLLFLKRVSDRWEIEYEHAYKEGKEDGLSDTDAKKEAKNAAYHEFVLAEDCRWDNIRRDVEKLPERFSKALKRLADDNKELRSIFDDIDFRQFTSNRENAEILRQLVELFSERKLHHVSPDILGDSYEWILQYFAPDRAKEGEAFTPREVAKLLVEILAPQPGESVYDPACASTGMLIVSYRHVRDNYGAVKAKQLALYGQEVNLKTQALGRMNIYIHDIQNVNLAAGDTLLYPKFKQEDGQGVKKFKVVIANPPWNQDGYDEEVLKKGEFWKQRFAYGFPPNASADWAWIQHMLASCEDRDSKGRVGVVLDSGCLFRGNKETTIRARFLDEKADFIECIILLPEKLFYNTGAPGVILILRPKKSDKTKDRILFINASKDYQKHAQVRKLNQLGEGNIKKIRDAYKAFEDIPGFCRVVSLDEIKKNEYNLNVTRYIDSLEDKAQIDLGKVWEELKALEDERRIIENKLQSYIKELGYHA